MTSVVRAGRGRPKGRGIFKMIGEVIEFSKDSIANPSCLLYYSGLKYKRKNIPSDRDVFTVLV